MAGITESLGQKVFIPFPKPTKDLRKCKRWLVACSREFFTEKNVNKNTYICALHWPGGKGPSDEFPDPLKANLTPKQAGRASRNIARSDNCKKHENFSRQAYSFLEVKLRVSEENRTRANMIPVPRIYLLYLQTVLNIAGPGVTV